MLQRVQPAGFLRRDVHVHRRGVAQKLMDRLKIEISFPNPRRTPLQLRLQQTDRQLNGWVERAVSLQRNPVRTARHRLLPRWTAPLLPPDNLAWRFRTSNVSSLI